ncbi:Cdc6/Cdc18 family protein [Thermoplasma sp.]|uniref:Cdc6/Cdc18 family protein n=1 Tax=Thermoplasma sp. TaxID=1973142 RepID=UPI00260D605A|nr:Cdc6/Cdc18 family protein [Thermoplasma sp.]
MVILINPSILESSFIPERLIARDAELTRIMETVIKPTKNGITTNLILYGDSGTGKTVTMRYLAREVKDPHVVYVNAIAYRYVKNVLIDFLSRFGIIVPERSSYASLFTRIESLLKDQGKNVILVIDEASSILKGDYDGLYYLFRSKDSFDVNISTIFVVMEDPAILFDSKIRKSYGMFGEMKFRRYTKNEIYQIVVNRAVQSLVDGGYDDDVLDYIAEVSAEYGSARVGIDILAKAAHIAEYRRSAKISFDDVRAARSMISPFVTESKLASMDYEDLLVLLAVCRCLSSSKFTDLDCVSQNLSMISEQYGKRDINLYDRIRKLENNGMISATLEGQGRGEGVKKMISIYDVPISILTERIENLLNA